MEAIVAWTKAFSRLVEAAMAARGVPNRTTLGIPGPSDLGTVIAEETDARTP
jgi:hypothetical protein